MEEKIPLSADHSLMVKFDSRDSKGYRVIVNRLKKFEKEAAQMANARFGCAFPTPPKPCSKPEFTRSNIQALASTTYSIFGDLKEKDDGGPIDWHGLADTVFCFKCGLDHLATKADALVDLANISWGLDEITAKFASTVDSLQCAVEGGSHMSGSETVLKIQALLGDHSASVQKLLEKAPW